MLVETRAKNESAPPPKPSMVRRAPITGKRLVLYAVAGLLIAAATVAIGILLFGDFGSTEGRILATTALLVGYGLLTLPAAILRDRQRTPALTAAVGALAVAAASLTTVTIWSDEPPEALGKAIGTLNVWLLASVQLAALTLLRRERDLRLARLLFVASSALAIVLASMLTALLWLEIDSERYGRAFGALLILNVLLVALQPILARARPRAVVHRLRVIVAADESIDLTVEAPDLAAAASKAIRAVERDEHRVLGLEFTDARAARGTVGRGVPAREP